MDSAQGMQRTNHCASYHENGQPREIACGCQMVSQGAVIIAGRLKSYTNWASVLLQRGDKAVEVSELVEDGYLRILVAITSAASLNGSSAMCA